MPKISIVSDKGGVGRSMLAVMLAEYLARRDYNVLAIGLDPHAVLARRLGYDMYGADYDLPNAAGLFRAGVRPGDAAELIHPCRWDTTRFPWAARIHVIPDHEDLKNWDCPPVQGNPASRPGVALQGVADQYDYVIADPAPRIAGTLAFSPWELADWLLGICAAHRDEIEGMLRMIQRVHDFRDEIGKPGLDVEGIVLNEYNPRSPKQRSNLEGMREAVKDHPGLVWDAHTNDSGVVVPMTIPNASFIGDSFDDNLPMDSVRNARNRVRIDDPMSLIVDRVLEVSARVAA